MQIIKLYKYKRANGGVTVSPVKPSREYKEMCRIVADEGMLLKKGDVLTSCADVDSTEGWTEVEDAEMQDDEK